MSEKVTKDMHIDLGKNDKTKVFISGERGETMEMDAFATPHSVVIRNILKYDRQEQSPSRRGWRRNNAKK